MNDIVLMTDHGSEEGSRPLLERAIERLAGVSPIVLDARYFMEGGGGRVTLEGADLTLEAPGAEPVVRPSVVVIYEIPPADRRRLASFQAALAGSSAVSLGADAQAWRNATEKQHMVRQFSRDRIPQMESIALERATLDTAIRAFESLGRGVWARPTIGWGGNDVFHLTSHEHLRGAFAYYAAAGMDWLVTRDAQNFNHQGRRHQFRVVVLGDRVLRVCEHVQAEPDRPCNESRGAVSTLLSPEALPAEMRQLAIRATRSLGLPFGGVDLAVESGGVIFEVNVHPVIDVVQGMETVVLPFVEAHLAIASPKWTRAASAVQ